jgi:spore germination cell wall hydrolase CwlJ-like protein
MKKGMLLLLVVLFTLSMPGLSGAITVSKGSVYVDGKPVKTSYFLNDGYLMVPAVFFANTGVKVSWSTEYKSIVFKRDEQMLGLPSGKTYADYLENNKTGWKREQLWTPTTDRPDGTYVPLLFVATKLGMDVKYDANLSQTYINTNPKTIKQDKLYWLYQVTEAEAGAESYKGKVAVAASILNRVESPDWPNTINDVVFQVTRFNGKEYYQFSPVLDKRIYNVVPSDETIRAVHQAVAGDDPSNGAIVFYAPRFTDNQWVRSRPVTVVIGNHIFTQ